MNSIRYIPDPDYYVATKDRPPSDFLVEAVGMLGPNQKAALDFGCGAGSETNFLLEHGFQVTAVDSNQDSEEYIMRLPHSEKVKFICTDFEHFSFGSYNLVNSARSLSFIHKDAFEDVLQKLIASITPGGLLVGDFYGIHDDWNQPDETMRFVDKVYVKSLFKDLNIIKLHEIEKDSRLATGDQKHIHLFTFLAQKVS